MYKLSIIIPVLNEQDSIEICLSRLQYLRKIGHEIIVVDGGSNDKTLTLATPLSDHIVQTKKSRSIQMNAGAENATGDCLLFLHADTALPDEIENLFSGTEADNNTWGRFDIRLSGKHVMFRVIEQCINLRSRLTGIATGDQAIFIEKKLFNDIDGYPEIALMEDVAISKLLLNHSKPRCFKEKVVSSSRRWERNGILKTILKMWMLRLLYFFNYDTNRLEKIYSST